MKTSANSVKTESETTSWMTFSSQIENGPPNCDDPMRLAGTWKQYSNRAMPQLSSTIASMPKRSSLDLNAMWPYQASVMKAFDMMSRATVAIPLNIGRRGLKPRKSINFFRMICAPRKKKPSATFFYRDGGRVSGVRCVWVRPAAGSVRMPCDRRCCRSAAARSLPGWGGAEPVDDDCRAPGRKSRGNCGRSVRPVARVISAKRQGR